MTKPQIISRLWNHVNDLLRGEKSLEEIEQELDLTEYYCRPYCEDEGGGMTITEMIAAQNRIISLQSEIIDGLYVLLAQHLSAEDIGTVPEVDKMAVAAQLRQNLEV